MVVGSVGRAPRVMRRAALLATAVVIALTGSVFAIAVPDSDGAINACFKTSDGSLRLLVSGSQCKKGEQPISWNQQGPTGDPGHLSLAGQVCPAGGTLTGFDDEGGLICDAPAISCPTNTTSTSFVNAGGTPVAGVEPTGVHTPTACRCPTIRTAVTDLYGRSVTELSSWSGPRRLTCTAPGYRRRACGDGLDHAWTRPWSDPS